MSEDAKCLAEPESCCGKGSAGRQARKNLLYLKISNIPEFNRNISLLISCILRIVSIRRKKDKHNYFKSIGTELAKFPIEIVGFRVRPIVKPIFFSTNHNLFYSGCLWQFIRNLLKLQKSAYLRLM
jgi:hypothetical protein